MQTPGVLVCAVVKCREDCMARRRVEVINWEGWVVGGCAASLVVGTVQRRE